MDSLILQNIPCIMKKGKMNQSEQQEFKETGTLVDAIQKDGECSKLFKIKIKEIGAWDESLLMYKFFHFEAMHFSYHKAQLASAATRFLLNAFAALFNL